jgi:four helix bundle protein
MLEKKLFGGHYTNLRVYSLSRELASDVFEYTKTFPKEERYSLTDQIRRSSRSVGAQIAEAWGKRRYLNHFISKMTDADAENLETQHWIDVALNCNYLTKDQATLLMEKSKEVGRMIYGMSSKPSLFCRT